MNRPDDETERAFADVRRRAAPLDRDRARISEQLRQQLGSAVVDGSSALRPAAFGGARVAAARGGWLGALVGVGAVTGALGFALGYGLGLRQQDAPEAVARVLATDTPQPAAPATDTPALHAGQGPGLPSDAPAPLAPAATVVAPPAPPSPPRTATPPSADAAEPGTARPATTHRPASGAASQLAFAEAVERLRRANRSLADGNAALSLIQLEELERLAGETLREERDVTRVLALCALGEVERAKRVADRMLAARSHSIYARRLEQSCAGGAQRPSSR